VRRAIPAVVATLCILAPVPAHAAVGCINKTEFGIIKQGWTRSQVETMIGAWPDFILDIENATMVGYNHCGGNKQMMAGVTFRNGVLWKKQWNWREL
jgi:hypothetical protein